MCAARRRHPTAGAHVVGGTRGAGAPRAGQREGIALAGWLGWSLRWQERAFNVAKWSRED